MAEEGLDIKTESLLLDRLNKEVDHSWRFSVSSINQKSREHEERGEDCEDKVYVSGDKKYFGIFDGVGGHLGGARAAQIALGTVVDRLEEKKKTHTLIDPPSVLKSALLMAGQEVWEVNRKEENKGEKNIGSTGVLVSLGNEINGEVPVYVVNVGDSRVYHFHDGELKQITLDDSLAIYKVYGEGQDAWDAQARLNNYVSASELEESEDDQYCFSKKNVLSQSLGSNVIDPKTYTFNIEKGDRVLIVSDGISDNLTDRNIRDILTFASSTREAVELLTQVSKRIADEDFSPINIRAKDDDMSAIVIEALGEVKIKQNNNLENELKKTQNTMEVFGVLREVGGIWGSKCFYPASQIQTITDQIRIGERTIREITNSFGLREVIAKLIKVPLQ